MERDDPRIEETIRILLRVGPKETARQFIAEHTATLMAMGVEMEAAKDFVEAMYYMGWTHGLTFFGTKKSAWPDGTPMFAIEVTPRTEKNWLEEI